MAELIIESIPSGGEVRIDGTVVGTTPLTIPIKDTTPIDMAIFVSPQYSEDLSILQAMQTYIDAVSADIGWHIAIVKVDRLDNRYDTIQAKINEIYADNPLKACMMVGEDMAEELNIFPTSINRKCSQAMPFWQSYGASFSTSCSEKVVATRNIIRVAVSLVYPNHDDSYNAKRSQIVGVLNKFSTNRSGGYGNNTISFYDTDFDFGEILKNEVGAIGDAIVIGNATQSEVDEILATRYKFVFAGGHGSPSTIAVNPHVAIFRAGQHGSRVNTPLLVVQGCSTAGWYTVLDDACLFQPPTGSTPWFGHTIFENGSMRAIIGGFPIGGYATDVASATGFICSECLYRMSSGITIAEAMLGITIYGSYTTLFGDPTFHY